MSVNMMAASALCEGSAVTALGLYPPVTAIATSKHFPVSARRKSFRDSFGGGFRKDSDLLREGDEARVVLVGAQERIIKQLSHTCVVRRPGVLQPLEHLLRLLAQGIDLSDLAAAVVGVFVDQFF